MPVLDYNNSVPNGPNDPADDQPEMLTNTQSINTWTNIDHIGYQTSFGGIHKQVTMRNQAAPGLGEGQGVLYANLELGDSWPFWQNAGSTAILLTNRTPLVLGNGYVSLPGGVLFQWGTITGAPIAPNAPVVFPIAFPAQVFSVTLGPQTNTTADKTINIKTGSLTVSGFLVSTSATSSFQSLSWMALGN